MLIDRFMQNICFAVKLRVFKLKTYPWLGNKIDWIYKQKKSLQNRQIWALKSLQEPGKVTNNCKFGSPNNDFGNLNIKLFYVQRVFKLWNIMLIQN